jgi:hypothetical protein
MGITPIEDLLTPRLQQVYNRASSAEASSTNAFLRVRGYLVEALKWFIPRVKTP